MCGRTVLDMEPDEIEHWTGINTWRGRESYHPSFNVCPTHLQPVIHRHTSTREPILESMKWGIQTLHGRSTSDAPHLVINCRDDTLTSSMRPMFKQIRNTHRCIVVARGYYEWQRGKSIQPYLVTLDKNQIQLREDQTHKASVASSMLMYLAAVWCPSKPPTPPTAPTYALVTTSASPYLSWLHHRMPVVLRTEADRALWMDPDISFNQTVADLMLPMNTDLMWHPVSKKVGKNTMDCVECIHPITIAIPTTIDSLWDTAHTDQLDTQRSLADDLANSSNFTDTDTHHHHPKLAKDNLKKRARSSSTSVVSVPSSSQKQTTLAKSNRRITDFFRVKDATPE
ncbi:hypothetical protein BASA61_003532 [Batrachochytrium salamandrivorans]|nr:hypothetical protein BASA61_003532 [Batrachochytrium salamandrivorans]